MADPAHFGSLPSHRLQEPPTWLPRLSREGKPTSATPKQPRLTLVLGTEVSGTPAALLSPPGHTLSLSVKNQANEIINTEKVPRLEWKATAPISFHSSQEVPLWACRGDESFVRLVAAGGFVYLSSSQEWQWVEGY